MSEQPNNQTIENCKMKLKTFTKLKLQAESELLKLRNQEQSLSEELLKTQNEVDYFMQEMEDTKSQITQTKHQISMIDICTKSEETKIEKYMNTLSEHKKAYETIFEKERDIIELRNKRKKEKEVEEEEQMKQKEREINEKNEQIAKDAVIVEGECEAIEKECVVLMKRNNAIMLKLRRMLVETEKARREMRKQNADIHPE